MVDKKIQEELTFQEAWLLWNTFICYSFIFALDNFFCVSQMMKELQFYYNQVNYFTNM